MTEMTTAVSRVPGGACAPAQRRRVRRARESGPVDLPVTGRAPAPTKEPETRAPSAPRILVVDQDPQTGAAIAAMLGARGGTVLRTVGRSRDALRWAAELRPDLVMVDAGLRDAAGSVGPTTDGLGAAAELHRRQAAPVVLMIGERAPSRERIATSGALGCVVKPLRPAAVLPAVEVALARSATLEALRDQVQDITARLRDRELVERAKGLLMTHRGMSEPQAFRWLQRTAMDRRTPMATVAAATVDRFAADQVAAPSPTRAAFAVVPPTDRRTRPALLDQPTPTRSS